MTYLPRRELYAMFLDSDWWRALSALKRRLVGRCEVCRLRVNLQSHHIRYPENWFDTTLDDLKVLCRVCHEREHGLRPEPEPAPWLDQTRAHLVASKRKPDPVIPGASVPYIHNMKDLQWNRQQGLISREEFRRLRAVLQPNWGLRPSGRKRKRKHGFRKKKSRFNFSVQARYH